MNAHLLVRSLSVSTAPFRFSQKGQGSRSGMTRDIVAQAFGDGWSVGRGELYVPMSQLSRYLCWASVSESMETPIAWSLSLPTVWSISLGTVYTLF